jgi:hypothetical protein
VDRSGFEPLTSAVHAVILDSLEDETGSASDSTGVTALSRPAAATVAGGDVGRMSGMNAVVGFAHQTGVKLAEVEFLLGSKDAGGPP